MKDDKDKPDNVKQNMYGGDNVVGGNNEMNDVVVQQIGLKPTLSWVMTIFFF